MAGMGEIRPLLQRLLVDGRGTQRRGLARCTRSTPRAITSITPCAWAGAGRPGTRGPSKACAAPAGPGRGTGRLGGVG